MSLILITDQNYRFNNRRLNDVMKKKCIYNLYQWFIVILTIIAFMSFALGIILEQFQLSSKINLFVLDLHLIVKMIGCILALCCSVHILVLFFQSVLSKQKHSFIWLLLHQAIPLFLPICLYMVISAIWGRLDINLSEILCGVFSGVASSILVLVLDRRQRLVQKVLSWTAPEYLSRTEE